MDSYYNSPPNWPPPPAGWRPTAGWTPDPSWPAPPPDWQFWGPGPTPPPARKKRRLWLIIGVPVAVVALISVAGITAFVMAVSSFVSPAKDAAGSYVQALQDQRYEAAFAMRCSPRAGDHDDFVAHWETLSSTGHGISRSRSLEPRRNP